jgi:hypothetical protein
MPSGNVGVLITLCYVVLQRILQLVTLRRRSIEFRQLEIVVLRHELAVREALHRSYRLPTERILRRGEPAFTLTRRP